MILSQIGCRDISRLKDKGLALKESEPGVLYENVTKDLFSKLGFHVDEKLRANLNTPRSKMDNLVNLGSKDVIIGECEYDIGISLLTYVDLLKIYESLKTKSCIHQFEF